MQAANPTEPSGDPRAPGQQQPAWETLAFEMPVAPMPSPLLCRNKGKHVQHGESWMDTGGTGHGHDCCDFSCSACRAGGKWNSLLRWRC